MTVQVVRVGDRVVTPTGVGVPQPTLEDLADLAGTAAAPTGVPLALEKGTDGVFRPVEVQPGDVDEQALHDLVVTTVDAVVPAAVDEALAGRRDYPHTQNQPSDLWQVPHHLGFLPTFTAYDTDGRPVMHAGITHPVPGQVSEVRFGLPLAGTGYAS